MNVNDIFKSYGLYFKNKNDEVYELCFFSSSHLHSYFAWYEKSSDSFLVTFDTSIDTESFTMEYHSGRYFETCSASKIYILESVKNDIENRLAHF